MIEPQPAADRPADPAAEGGDFDIGRYLGIIRKHKWVILATFAVGITAAVLWTLRQPVIYEASGSVIINPRAPQVYGNKLQEVVQLGTGSYWSNQEYYNTQLDIIESYDFAKEAVLRYKLYDNPALVGVADRDRSEKERIAIASRKVSSGVNASHKEDSRVVTIKVRNRDAKLATLLANDLIETYIESNLEVRSRGTGEATKILSSERSSAETELREAENELYQFKKDAGLLSVSLDAKLSLIAGKLEHYSTALSDARIKRIEVGAVRAQAKGSMGTDVLESPVFALTEDTTAETLKSQYFDERQKFLELSETLGPKHPAYQAQKKKVDDAYAALQREAKLAMHELDDRYAAAQAQEQQFRAEVDRLKQEALELGPKRIAFARLLRLKKGAEDRYDLVVGRLRDSKLAGRNKLGNIHHHQDALAGHQVAPRMKVNIAVAAMLSLCLGLALAFGLEYLDRTVKSAEEVEGITGAPLLGMIPAVATGEDPAGNVKDRDLYIFQHPTSQAAECCRSIRTNILFSGVANKLRALTVTSPSPREGKTTSAIYLGTTMAQSGQRVLLVDTDMRRPRLHKALGVPRGHGLSSLLIGESSFEDAIKTTDIPNLFLLPCGPMPPNPAELLLTDTFSNIIGELRERFDRILFDSPPVQAVSDAAVLARLSDGVVLVAHGGKTSRDELARAAHRLSEVNANTVGVILNNLDITNRKYGYYYYQYAYGQNDTNPTETASGLT